MPTYFFDIDEDGDLFVDFDGVEFTDEAAAKQEAIRIAGDLARDHLPDLTSSRVEVSVRDDHHRTICRERVEVKTLH